MARTSAKGLPKLNTEPIVEVFGMDEVVEQLGMERIVEQVRKKKNLAKLVLQLTPAERSELKRQLERDAP